MFLLLPLYYHEIFDDSNDYKEAYDRIDLEFEGIPNKNLNILEPLLPPS